MHVHQPVEETRIDPPVESLKLESHVPLPFLPVSFFSSRFRVARTRRVPLPLPDVARICRKIRVWRKVEIHLTSGRTWNKKNFASGVFWGSEMLHEFCYSYPFRRILFRRIACPKVRKSEAFVQRSKTGLFEARRGVELHSRTELRLIYPNSHSLPADSDPVKIQQLAGLRPSPISAGAWTPRMTVWQCRLCMASVSRISRARDGDSLRSLRFAMTRLRAGLTRVCRRTLDTRCSPHVRQIPSCLLPPAGYNQREAIGREKL